MEPSGSQSFPRSCLAFSRTRKGLVLSGEIVLCLLALVTYAASYTAGYAGLAACELVLAALVLLAWGARLPPRLPQIHWGWERFPALRHRVFALPHHLPHRHHRAPRRAPAPRGGLFGLLAGFLLGYDAYITLPTRQSHSAAPTESPDGA